MVAELKAKFVVDGQQLETGIKKAEKGVKGLGKELGGLTASMAGMMSGGVIAGAFVSFAAGALAAADELKNLQDSTGMSIRGLQTIKAIGEDSGVTFEKLEGVINRIAAAQSEALADSTSTAAKQFKQMGIELKSLEGMSPENVLEAVGRAAASAGNDADKLNGVIEMVGVRSKRVMEILKRVGSEGFSKLGEEADKTGQVLSDNATESLAAWEDNIAAQRRADANVGRELLAFSAQQFGLAPKTFADENDLLSKIAAGNRADRMERLGVAPAEKAPTLKEMEFQSKLRAANAAQVLRSDDISDSLRRIGGGTAGTDSHLQEKQYDAILEIARNTRAAAMKDTTPKFAR
jgi:hypothetical protein